MATIVSCTICTYLYSSSSSPQPVLQVRSTSSDELQCPPAAAISSYLKRHLVDFLITPPHVPSNPETALQSPIPQSNSSPPPVHSVPALPGVTIPSGDLSAAQCDAAAVAAVVSILEMASLVGCDRASVVLDLRTHPAESVLQAGLAALQGPALCIQLYHCHLSLQELFALQMPTHPFHVRDQLCRYAPSHHANPVGNQPG